MKFFIVSKNHLSYFGGHLEKTRFYQNQRSSGGWSGNRTNLVENGLR
jgi:hypothetical protein